MFPIFIESILASKFFTVRKIFNLLFVFLSCAVFAQDHIIVLEKDAAASSYVIDDLSKVVFDSTQAKFYLEGSYHETYQIKNISKVYFSSEVSGCMDPLAYNFVVNATNPDSCRYVNLDTSAVTTGTNDTVAANPQDVCDTMKISQAVESVKILSYVMFGQHIEVSWELQQEGKLIVLKALYRLPNDPIDGPVLFVLHLKCQTENAGKRTVASSATHQSFAASIVLGPTNLDAEQGIRKSELMAFPNPFSEEITLRYALASEVKVSAVEIVDVNGRVVHVLDHDKFIGNGEQVVYMGHLPSGAYTVRLSTGTNVLYQKIVKL